MPADSDQRPFAEINVVCRLQAATEIPELAVDYTAVLFDVLHESYDADLLGVSLPQPATWAGREDGIGALIGFELSPVLGSDPVARLAEMTAHIAAGCPPV